MTIRNGYATITYRDWKHHLLHYRGQVELSGAINLSHLNDDGSRSVFSMQISGDTATGEMQLGNCDYKVDLTRS
jgi:hypothetical protein